MRLFLLLLLACTLVTAPVWAGEGRDAVEKAKIGRERYDAGEWEAALQLFREAEQLYHSPVLVLYAARSLRNLGRLREARERYQALADEQLADDVPEAWRRAQRDGATDMAALDIPTIVVQVFGAEGGVLTIDGASAAMGEPVEVDPGDHVVAVVVDDRRQERIVTVARGERAVPSFDFRPAITAQPPSPAPLPRQNEPTQNGPTQNGPTQNGPAQNEPTQNEPTQNEPTQNEPTQHGDSLNVPALVLTLVGASAVAGGVVVGVVALRKKSAADEALPATCFDGVCPSTVQAMVTDSYGDARTLGYVSDGLWVGGAALAAAGIVLWIVGPFGDSPVEARASGLTVRF